MFNLILFYIMLPANAINV